MRSTPLPLWRPLPPPCGAGPWLRGLPGSDGAPAAARAALYLRLHSVVRACASSFHPETGGAINRPRAGLQSGLSQEQAKVAKGHRSYPRDREVPRSGPSADRGNNTKNEREKRKRTKKKQKTSKTKKNEPSPAVNTRYAHQSRGPPGDPVGVHRSGAISAGHAGSPTP